MRSVVLSTVLALSASVASAETCTGLVFVDANGDGRRDTAEPGLPGVAIVDRADGRVVRTGGDGRYAFTATPATRAAIVKPAGHALPRRANGLPDFAPRATTTAAPAMPPCGDFPLRVDPRPAGKLRALVFADPQVRSPAEVGFYGTGIIDAVLRRHAAGPGPGTRVADLGLTLGDIVHDQPALYPAMNRQTGRLGVPWLHAPGNHDLDFDSPDDAGSLRSYAAVFGPDTLAWEEHEAAFILLDDVVYRPGQTPDYIGGLREDQFAFLAAYLATLPSRRPLVIGAHIPFFDGKPGVETFRRGDRERLFALLRRFAHVLLLSGHGHVQRQHFHGADDGWHGVAALHEYNVGAACGSFWSGPEGADGVPLATMADGTPRGWADLALDAGGGYALRWNAVDPALPADAGIALHAPRVLRRGAWPGFAVYANVFMGDAGSVVEYRIDDGAWQPMQRVLRPDPRLLALNVADDAAVGLRAFDRLPEAADSTHLWRGALPTGLAAGEHRIQVRAMDRWRGPLTAEADYRLQELAPR